MRKILKFIFGILIILLSLVSGLVLLSSILKMVKTGQFNLGENFELLLIIFFSLIIVPITQIIILIYNKAGEGNNQKRRATALFTLAFFFVLQVISQYFLIFGNMIMNLKLSSSAQYMKISAISELTFMLILISLYYQKEYLYFLKNFFNKDIGKKILEILGFFVIGLFLTYYFAYLGNLLFPGVGNNTENQKALEETMKNSQVWWVFISTVIAAPLYEEFTFRFSLAKLFQKTNKIIVIIIGTLVFSALHAIAATDLITFAHDMFSYIGLSFILMAVYIYKKNIFYTMGIHLLNNLWAFIIIYSLHK